MEKYNLYNNLNVKCIRVYSCYFVVYASVLVFLKSCPKSGMWSLPLVGMTVADAMAALPSIFSYSERFFGSAKHSSFVLSTSQLCQAFHFSAILSIFRLYQAFFFYTERFIRSAKHFSSMLNIFSCPAKHFLPCWVFFFSALPSICRLCRVLFCFAKHFPSMPCSAQLHTAEQ